MSVFFAFDFGAGVYVSCILNSFSETTGKWFVLHLLSWEFFCPDIMLSAHLHIFLLQWQARWSRRSLPPPSSSRPLHRSPSSWSRGTGSTVSLCPLNHGRQEGGRWQRLPALAIASLPGFASLDLRLLLGRVEVVYNKYLNPSDLLPSLWHIHPNKGHSWHKTVAN